MTMFNSPSPFQNRGFQDFLNQDQQGGNDLIPLQSHFGFATGGGRGPWPLAAPMGVNTITNERGQTFIQPGGGPGVGDFLGGGVLRDALGRDVEAFQQAADRQHARNNEQIANFEQFLGQAPGMIQDIGFQTGGELAGLAGQAFGLGQEQLDEARMRGDDLYGDVVGGIDNVLDQQRGDVEARIELSDKLVKDAIKQMQSTIAQFKDRTAQDAAAMASGIRRSAQSQMQMARAGINPDGTPMTQAQQSQIITQIQGRTQEQVNEAVTPLYSAYNQAAAQLGTQLSQLQTQGAGLALEGGKLLADLGQRELAGEQLKAQTGVQLHDAFLQAQAGQRQMFQIGATLADMSTQVRNAAVLSSVNLEMQGRELLANLVAANPESVVSWFQGLLSMYSVEQAARG